MHSTLLNGMQMQELLPRNLAPLWRHVPTLDDMERGCCGVGSHSRAPKSSEDDWEAALASRRRPERPSLDTPAVRSIVTARVTM